MQTFLPYTYFPSCAKVLDNKRLGKQRVECLQILNALSPIVDKRGWATHPAVVMWFGFEQALINYGLDICSEWISRGFNDTCFGKIKAFRSHFDEYEQEMPDWLEDPRLLSSHRSNLLRKDSEHYGQWGWTEPDDLPYFWPSQQPDYAEYYDPKIIKNELTHRKKL